MFFVGTAPSGDDGHINVSPKGPIGSLRVLDDHTVAYLDIVGSGAETIAHLRENGRICVMFCAFDGPPRILRLHGDGEYVRPGRRALRRAARRSASPSPRSPSRMRAFIVVHVTRIADSCGYGVPLMSYEGERPHMDLSTAKRIRVEGGGRDARLRARAQLRSRSTGCRRCHEHHRRPRDPDGRGRRRRARVPARHARAEVRRRRRRLADLRAPAGRAGRPSGRCERDEPLPDVRRPRGDDGVADGQGRRVHPAGE